MIGAGELPFQNAKEECELKNSYLLEPRTRELNDIAKYTAGSGQIWIGATDMDVEGSWIWQSDNSTFTGSYTNWRKGQPNDHGSGQDCATVGNAGSWGDIGCSDVRPYVCYTESRKSTI